MNNSRLVFDKKGEFAINFYWAGGEEVNWMSFSGAEVCSDYTDENNPEFITFDTGYGADSDCFEFKDVKEEDLFFTGFIKWDGCMEIHNLYHHFCYNNDILQRVIDLIYNSGEEIMTNKLGFDDNK